MTDELTEESRARPMMGVRAGVWAGVLLPPAIWAVQMQLNYWAVRGACARGSNVRLSAITIVALLLIILSGLCGFISVGRARKRVEWGAVVSNSRFMWTLGLLMCAIFFVAVFAQGLAAIIFSPCQL
ncbi:MAG TPA: hypothetical protein VGN86_01975 [Pyrinomonadaceae bacterium]|nr:hypothetical protein [Pyrinomonadaceae bacterium]